MGQTVKVERDYHFTAHKLKLPAHEVVRLAAALSATNGISAKTPDEGRNLYINISAKNTVVFKKIEETMLGKMKHAFERFKNTAQPLEEQDQAMLAYLRGK